MSRWKTILVNHNPASYRIKGIDSVAGVYAVFGDGELRYIGSSVNLMLRLASYKIRHTDWSRSFNKIYVETPWGDFGQVVIKIKPSVKSGDWLMDEYRLIKKLSPPANSRL